MDCMFEDCHAEAYSEDYPYCLDHVTEAMGYEKQIGVLKDFVSLQGFFTALQEEFKLTNFPVIVHALTDNESANIDISLRYDDCSSSLHLSIHARKIRFAWNTVSGHLIRVVGCPDEYTVSIGTDFSFWFYPSVLGILERLMR